LASVITRYLAKYQGAIFSHASFVPELESPCFIVPPSIDPFAPVNESLSPAEISRTLIHLGIPEDRPLALQFLGSNCASDALEAVRVWKSGLIPEHAVLVLIRIGDGLDLALQSELDAIRGLDRNLRVVQLVRDSHRELCALGWAAQVVLEPTNCRWPSLDLLDVMWKGTAALVSIHSGTAPFVREGCGVCVANRTELTRKLGELLEDSKCAKEMGACAHLSIGRHHLIPRHLLDYLKLMTHFVGAGSRA
jgi:trehalose synthase